jgi:hypothetical protein
VLRGVDSVTIYRRGGGGKLVAEVPFINPEGRVQRVVAHYSCAST